MVRRRSTLLLGFAVLLGIASPFWAPGLLRRTDWFTVQRVEVVGTRLLAPHTVLAVSGIRTGHSIWEDPARWEQALQAYPAIDSAKVSRRMPHTLRVRIHEAHPVAFVEADALHPVTVHGDVLPIDPAQVAVDLPIVRGPWPDTAQDPITLRLLAEVGRLQALDPGLLAETSEVRSNGNDPGVLLLSHRVGEIVLPAGLGSQRLAELRAVLGDIERRHDGEQVRVDLRFRDQIVVRLLPSV